MNYYVDIHSNLLPELAGLGNRPMTETEAAARISELQESNIKQAVAAPYFDPAAMPAEDFLALRDAKLAALAVALWFILSVLISVYSDVFH